MDLARVPWRAGDGSVHVVVESPRGSTLKLKYDPELGAFVPSRPLALGLSYPYDWGFVPSTIGSDGDPLDAMLLWECASHPGVVVPARLVGVLEAEQDAPSRARVRNDRLVAIPRSDPRGDDVTDVRQLPQRVRDELAAFFVAAVALEQKNLAVLGWKGPDAADALVRSCARR